MRTIPTTYEAELDYRREQVRRQWRPIGTRRRAGALSLLPLLRGRRDAGTSTGPADLAC